MKNVEIRREIQKKGNVILMNHEKTNKQGEMRDCYVRVIGNTAEIWVPKTTSEEKIWPYVERYQSAGYQVVSFYSGNDPLLWRTEMLMDFNAKT